MGAALGNRELQRERREELLNAPASFLSRWPLPLHLPVFSSFPFLSSPLFCSFLFFSSLFRSSLKCPAFPFSCLSSLEHTEKCRLYMFRDYVLHRRFTRGSMSNHRRKRNRFISRFNFAKWSNFAIDLNGCSRKRSLSVRQLTLSPRA